ncbi:hypothetical protein V1478_003954 [Vespula squamosa]|uniref:Uncharacterized protein n=1 Tax=Vespula squamosa TaxID=30214 RepID=A0ABD2BNB5_VESSQ
MKKKEYAKGIIKKYFIGKTEYRSRSTRDIDIDTKFNPTTDIEEIKIYKFCKENKRNLYCF